MPIARVNPIVGWNGAIHANRWSATDAPLYWRNLVGCWAPCLGAGSLNSTGTQLFDHSGYGAHGTFASTTYANLPSPIGPAVDFEPSNAVNADAPKLECTTGLTVFGVLRLNSSQTTRNIINRAQGGGTVSGWGVGVSDTSANRLKFYSATSGGSGNNIDGLTALTTGAWHSVGFTYFPASSGTNKYIYLDGKIDNSTAWSGTLGYTSCVTGIGYYRGGSSQYIDATIALLMVFNRYFYPVEFRRFHTDPLFMFRTPASNHRIGKAGSAAPQGRSSRGKFVRKHNEPRPWYIW